MVGGKKTKARSGDVMGSHQRCWLWGRNVVLETLRARCWRPHEIVHSDEIDPPLLDEVRRLTDAEGILLCQSTPKQLRDLIRAEDHQGLAARMPPYPYLSARDAIQALSKTPLLLVLDRIQDPFNFGAILRNAEILGVDLVLVGSHGQSDVTAQVVRSSAGAVNHLKIARADDLPRLFVDLADRGVRLVGASERGDRAPFEADLSGSIALVIGNEGSGLSEASLSACHELLRIPQFGQIGSLNAAVASGILCYEAMKQRRFPGTV